MGLLMLFEARVNRLILAPGHVVFAIWYGLLYLVFSWIWFWNTGKFWYFFIDWRSPVAVFGYLVLLVVLWGAFHISACVCVRLKPTDVSSNELMIISDVATPRDSSGE